MLRAYPDSAKQRTKDGYLPLHLAAHWGVSSLDVVAAILRTYPDASVGRNRFERTPLEEALVIAGENGRPHQVGLVRSLRRHPSHWAAAGPSATGASAELNVAFSGMGLGRGVSGNGGMADLQGLLSPGEPRPPSSNVVDVDASFDDEDTADDVAGGVAASLPSGGFMARISPLLSGSGRKSAATSSGGTRADAVMALAAKTPLASLVQLKAFSSIPYRLDLQPNEATQPLLVMVRGGYTANVTPLYLLCEQNPPVDILRIFVGQFKNACAVKKAPGGQLPLHAACTWHASPDIVTDLLAAFPEASQSRDDLTNLPLHCACFSGTSIEVVEALVKVYPKAVSVQNGQGSTPSDIVKRLRHANRMAVLALLEKIERKLLIKRRQAERNDGVEDDLEEEGVEATLYESYGSKPKAPSPMARKKKNVTVKLSPSSSPESAKSEDGMLWV